MAEKYEAPATYTDQELVDLYRHLLARGAVAGEEYQIGTKRVRFPGAETALNVISRLEAKIAAETSGPAITLARLHRS